MTIDKRVVFYLSGFDAGGTERVTLLNANALADRGCKIELLVCHGNGPLVNQVSTNVQVTCLTAASLWQARSYAIAADPAGLGKLLRPVLLPKKPSRTLPYLPALARFLQRNKPAVLLSAMAPLNVETLLARRLANVATRVVISEHSNLSHDIASARFKDWRRRNLAALLHRTYLWANAIVTVSHGVGDDLAAYANIPRERITTIYNPVVTSELFDKAREVPNHPWFKPGAPPVVLGVGRLARQKDFPTLLQAFARLRIKRRARLMILGQANNRRTTTERQAELMALAAKLGITDDVALPGFVHNPYAYMAHAGVFVLSSRFEGLPTVLIEALACGLPVVSTDCPNGPAEILENGKYGSLVPVGDAAALAEAISATLDAPLDRDQLRTRALAFTVDRAIEKYEKILFPSA